LICGKCKDTGKRNGITCAFCGGRSPALAKKQQEENAGKETESDKRRAAIEKVLLTEDGIKVFQWIREKCGDDGNGSILVNGATGEINVQTSLHNESMRSVWLQIRKEIPRTRLIQIELPEARRREKKTKPTK
jgi:hypothetical protein